MSLHAGQVPTAPALLGCVRGPALSQRTRDHIAMLTRTRDIDPSLAHAVRVRVRRGVTYEEAQQIIGLLRDHPVRDTGT